MGPGGQSPNFGAQPFVRGGKGREAEQLRPVSVGGEDPLMASSRVCHFKVLPALPRPARRRPARVALIASYLLLNARAVGPPRRHRRRQVVLSGAVRARRVLRVPGADHRRSAPSELPPPCAAAARRRREILGPPPPFSSRVPHADSHPRRRDGQVRDLGYRRPRSVDGERERARARRWPRRRIALRAPASPAVSTFSAVAIRIYFGSTFGSNLEYMLFSGRHSEALLEPL